MKNSIFITLFLVIISSSLYSQAVPPVRMIAEWEPVIGTLIRWPLGISSELVAELAEDDSLYILVETLDEEQQAISSFANWGVNLEHCRFIYTSTYSHWTRDWGPQCLFDGAGEIGILDPIFDGYPWVPPGTQNTYTSKSKISRDWSEDDAVNASFGLQMGWESYELPAYLTGGNVMYDGYGTAFSSEQMLNENLPLMNNVEFYELVLEYAGIENYNIISNFENYGIQHIDCIAKLLDEETVLIKEVDIWHPDYFLIEDVAAEFEGFLNCFGRPYNIIRIYCDYYMGNDVAAYTNSLILNKKILVPLFNISSDDSALETYQDAMPGYEIIGFQYPEWYYYDALHCRAMGIFDPEMIRIEHNPLTGSIISNEDYLINCKIIDYSQNGLIDNSLKVFWKTDSTTNWNELQLELTAVDSFQTQIPHHPEGTEISYYISAEANSGQTATKPITAPDALFTFVCEELAETCISLAKPDIKLNIYPNPFNPVTTISLAINNSINEYINLKIYNLKGQIVKSFQSRKIENSQNFQFVWDSTDQTGQPVSSGIYYIQVKSGATTTSKKCLLMK